MIKTLFTLLTFGLSIMHAYSQDTITKKTGDIISAKVLEIDDYNVKFKNFDNLNGPLISTKKTSVYSIKYENGTVDIFVDNPNNKNIVYDENNEIDMFYRGEADAVKFYTRYKAASTTTLVVSLISPLAGLAPAVGFSVIKPQKRNLNYPNPELIKNPEYFYGYSNKAKKMKRSKVWTNFGIGAGVNVAVTLVAFVAVLSII